MGWEAWAHDVEVLPSVYAADFGRLAEHVDGVLAAGARVLHFDVGDGRFVSEITIGPVVLRALAPVAERRGAAIDCHLMIVEPESQFERIRAAGGQSVTFHVEAVEDARAAIRRARALGLGAGVACNPDTPVEALAEAAADADLALLMSIHPGLSGQTFMPEALPRLARLRELLPERVRVEVDGGVNATTIADARAAGADLLVAGSAIFWQPDAGAAYRSLAAAAG